MPSTGTATRGGAVGPDRSRIGAGRMRRHLLESLIEPSREIEPAYRQFLVETDDGRILLGAIPHRDGEAITVRDMQGKLEKIPLPRVRRVTAQSQSLMPAGLLGGLTVQQAADLLEFLSTRR